MLIEWVKRSSLIHTMTNTRLLWIIGSYSMFCFCFCVCPSLWIMTKHWSRSHTAHTSTAFVLQLCISGTKKRVWQSSSSWSVCVFDTQVSGALWTCAATPNITRGKTEDPSFLFSPLSARRNATPAKLLGSTMSAGVIQLSTGLLPGITPALFNTVIQTTIECCFITVISQTLRSLTASIMSPWNFCESVPGFCPASAGEVHERAQLPLSNLHSDTHQQACMAPIDRLMVEGRTEGCVAVLKSGQL